MFENALLADLAIGRSTVRQRILALLIREPLVRLHLREIQRRVGTSPGTASRELAKLVAAGLIDREAEGVQVYFRASDSPIAAMMRQLLLIQTEKPVASAPPRIARPRKQRPGQAPIAPAEIPAIREAAAAPEAPEAKRTDESSLVIEPPASSRLAPAANLAAPTAPIAPAVSPAPPDPLALVVAARFCAAIRPLYEQRLKSVYLYGARASSPAPEDSDIELLVVLDAVASYGEELERTSSVCAQLSLELGLVVSRVFAAENGWTDPGRGFVAVMPREEPGR